MNKDLKTIFGTQHGLDQKSVNFLTNALEKSNLPGFDYLEFKQALAALGKMDMDEPTAFKSAFAAAATMGLTKDRLITTANHYKTILNKEHQQFDVALKSQMNTRVNGKLQEVEHLKEQIVKHQQKIVQLEEQIKKFQATIDNADSDVQDAKSRIASTKENFVLTYQSIMNEIDKDVENINLFLS